MPRNLPPPTREGGRRDKCGRRCRKASRRKVPQKTNRLARKGRVRVKRWGKSPPLQAQARRHGKPHRVQGQIGDPGAARSVLRLVRSGSRVLAAKTNDSLLRVTSGQTEFGLQPFQNLSSARECERPCEPCLFRREWAREDARPPDDLTSSLRKKHIRAAPQCCDAPCAFP